MKLLCRFFALLLMLCAAIATGAERFVPHGGTLNYANIQAALNSSVAGDIIRVQPGTYSESLIFPPRNVTLTSMNPADSNIVQSTIIQSDGRRSVLTITNGQATNTVVTGFTIRGGRGSLYSGYLIGGAVFCYRSSPSLVGNIFEENHLTSVPTNLYKLGGAIGCWDSSPRIVRNILRNNSAELGGAILTVGGRPVIQDNWIYTNFAQTAGGAYLSDDGAFLNNTLVENAPESIYADAVGIMANNIITHSGGTAGVTTFAQDIAWFQNNNIWVPNGIPMYRVVLVGTNYEAIVTNPAGTNGNISADPRFVDPAGFNFHLQTNSPCINAGDPTGLRSTNELDIAGNPRVFALRVDMGASEFNGEHNFAPIANAGADRTVNWVSGGIALDGSASIDPNGTALMFEWTQIAGPPATMISSSPFSIFAPSGLGVYEFQLIVNDGVQSSAPDTVRILVTNLPPIASAGFSRNLLTIPAVLTLDGTHSLDPEGAALAFEWLQTQGPAVALSDPHSSRPTFQPTTAGSYEFQLVVRDQFSSSAPERVTFHLGAVPPIANAGPVRYAGRTSVVLDGSRSFLPNGSEPLTYAWRQVSGPRASLSATNIARPVVTGMMQTNAPRELEFELVVSAGGLTSAPALTKVIIVPAWNNVQITQLNPPFNTNRPAIFAFGGGNCDTGGSMSFPSAWSSAANVFSVSYSRDVTSPANNPRYFGYGDQLIVMLSSVAPVYNQRIQTIGFSTGCMPACDVAERFNITYRDPRYLVNRITFLDSGCSRDYDVNISNLRSNQIPGKMFWVDNYYSSAGRFRPGVLNVQFPTPPADHGTPNSWYFPSWTLTNPYRTNTFNNGVIAGAFFSLVGPGKNFQIDTRASELHFGWGPLNILVFPLNTMIRMDSIRRPARLPGAVELVGPANGAMVSERRVVFTCQPVLHAVKYEILVGPDASRTDRIAWEGPSRPQEPLRKLPYPRTWWTIRVTDAFGNSSWADPRSVLRDTDLDTLTDEAEVLTYLTDPDNADTDGDRHLDGEELIAGTSPFVQNFGLELFHRELSPTQLRFSWFSETGKVYELQTTTALDAPWSTLTNFNAPALGGPILHIVERPEDTFRAYRLRSHNGP